MFQPQKAPSLYCVPTKLWQKKQSDSPLSAPTAARQKEGERECYSFNSLNEKRIKVHETKCLMRSSRIKFLFHQLVSICSGRWTKWALRHRNTSKYLFRACLCVCESVRMHLHSMSSYKKSLLFALWECYCYYQPFWTQQEKKSRNNSLHNFEGNRKRQSRKRGEQKRRWRE